MLARSAVSAATRTRSRTLLSRRFSSVPVVDLGAPSAPRDLDRAAREVGFFLLVNHGVPEALRTRVLSLARSFFARPQAAKDALSIRQSTSWRGYQRVYENVTGEKPDAHEALDLYSESPRATHHRGANLWPDAEFEAVYIEYVDELLGVGRTTMRHFSKGLGLRPDYFDRLYDDSFWCMRAIHYPDAPEAEPRSEFGCGAHTDYGCLTLLLTDERRGALQARNLAGDWVSIDPVPGAFVCNIGDMLSLWTGGQYASTPHRVVRAPPPPGETATAGRVSVPFFFEPNYDALIAPIAELSGQAAAAPPAVMYGEHLLNKTSSNFAL